MLPTTAILAPLCKCDSVISAVFLKQTHLIHPVRVFPSLSLRNKTQGQKLATGSPEFPE